jgi:hypothetical protein
MRLLAIPALLLFCGVVDGAEPFSPDLSLIRNWNQAFYQSHPYQPFPKTLRFEGSKTFTYVASKHKDWKNSQEKIRIAIKTYKPQILLIEGIAKSDGVSPRVWDDRIKQDLNVEGFEAYYANKLALQERIPFVGAELEGKMSDHTSYERDIAVVSYVAELLNKYDNVMVVYGAGHYVQQELVLEKMLGSPKLIP